MPVETKIVKEGSDQSKNEAFFAHGKEALDIISRYGQVDRRDVNGDQVLSMPSRTVPEHVLDRRTWKVKTPMGNIRSVFSVDSLTTGEKPGIVVRGPERRYTSREDKLNRGRIWWDGSRSADKPVVVDGPVVEAQTLWEAATLLELRNKGMSAEVPQAVIVGPDGKASLVVNEIKVGYAQPNGPDQGAIMEQVKKKTSLVPEDATGYNSLSDRTGKLHLIDVNRWQWPQTGQMTELTKAIRNKIKEVQAGKAKKGVRKI